MSTFKVHLSVPVRVEDLDDPLDQRVLLQLGQRHELLHAERARVVQVQLLEPLPQPLDLVGIDWAGHRGRRGGRFYVIQNEY